MTSRYQFVFWQPGRAADYTYPPLQIHYDSYMWLWRFTMSVTVNHGTEREESLCERASLPKITFLSYDFSAKFHEHVRKNEKCNHTCARAQPYRRTDT
jgi:hypothetical protein